MKKSRILQKFPSLILIFALVAVLSPVGGASAVPQFDTPAVVAFDMVGSASQNLISFTDDPTVPFTSAADGFTKFARGVSPTIPFSVLDDSLSIFTSDSLGIIKEGNTDVFFGVTDTVNGDTAGPVTATWVFDISGASNLNLSIDMGAMGDFESSDTFVWEYSIDGGATQTAFSNTVDEASSHIYTLEGGASFELNDPMLVNGTVLTNDLQTFTTALTGSGSELTLNLTANTDGGSEAFVFQNLIIEGSSGPAVIAFDMVASASQNLISFTDDPTVPFTSAADGFTKFARGVSPTIPFSVLDDSLSIFTSDSLGIIKEGNTDVFFGVTDTVNGDTSGPVTATWVFDIGGASDLSLSIDMGAMGDFESSDTFVWEYSIDGGATQTAFSNTVDEASSHIYTLEGGASFELNDPMLVNGTVLTNDLQTFTTALTGSGSELTLTLTANTDGGSEAFVFQNLIIEAGSSGPAVIAFDMVASASQNLISFTDDPAIPFTSAADGFNKFARGVSPTIPFSVLDDSLSIFTSDSLGIIKEGNTDVFFGVTDTVNGDTNGPVTATWVFDISGATDLGLSIDMGAMGDFESSDTFVWEYSIDGGAVQTAFSNTVDEASSHIYTLEGGASFELNDPMLVDGTVLTNDLQTFTTALSGTGSELTLSLTANTDGGSEAFAFQNIIIQAGSGGGGGPEPEVCGDPFTPIFSIQGNGEESPLAGTEVATEGIVVGDFQDGKSGFFIQDPVGDGDPSTSDGIFVFYTGMEVNVGDHVRVRGTAVEFFGLTEINSVSQVLVCSTGNSVAPTTLSLPVTSLDDFEAYEGMLVTFPQALYISEYYNFDRFGEIVLSTDRQFQPTAVFDPGSTEAADLALANSLSRITLDDGRGSENPDPAIHPNGSVFDLNNLFRGGDTVANVTGVLDYNFGLYKVQPTQGADYSSLNPRTESHDPVGGNLKVASFNVLNYFTTLDYPTGAPLDNMCGPMEDQECRGADSDQPDEFTRQRDKIIAAIAAIDADVVGLIEIENHPGDVPTADLVAGLNDAMGAGTYDYVATGAIGIDAIRVAFIYKPASVSLVGDYAVLDDQSFTNPLGYVDEFGNPEEKSRPALAQTFIDNETGGIFTAVINHFKSKGSSCGPGDDDPEMGSCNLTRTLGAQALLDWLAGDPTGSGDPDMLIIGDLNSYDKEDPIDELLLGGYTDLVAQYQGEYAYSYVFDGQLGYLDHALANVDLHGEVTGVTIWHINSDEPDLIDYDTSFKKDAQDAIYAPDAYRSSDHDPVIVGLDVCDEIAPTFDQLSVSPDTLWPANHKYVDILATVVVSDNFDPNPMIELVSVTSNEPDNGEDDGDTVDDIVIVDDFTFMLRAERSGVGTGRIYTITYMVTDACGNSTTQSVIVTVPLSQGN